MKELKFRVDNRKIIRKHVEDIKESIQKHGFLSCKPIIINDEGEVIDGQHRYIACCELGIEPPVLNLGDLSASLMVDLNKCQKSWSILDFVNFHAEQGNEPFIVLRSFINTSKLAVTPSILILTEGKEFLGFDTIKDGSFNLSLSAEEYSDRVKIALEINNIAKMMDLHKGNKAITQAYLMLLKADNFDREYFQFKIRRHKDFLSLCGSAQSYLRMFINVYNYNKKSGKISL